MKKKLLKTIGKKYDRKESVHLFGRSIWCKVINRAVTTIYEKGCKYFSVSVGDLKDWDDEDNSTILVEKAVLVGIV